MKQTHAIHFTHAEIKALIELTDSDDPNFGLSEFSVLNFDLGEDDADTLREKINKELNRLNSM